MQKDESLNFLHPLIALEWQLVIQMWDVLDACWQPMLYNVQAQMTHPFPVLFERMHSRLLLLTTLILPIILSGTESSHDTVTVLFQEAHAVPNSKPPVSSDRLSKTTCFIQNKLMCQDVPIHCKPAVRPSLPSGFQVIEDTDLPILKNTIDETCRHERLISLLRISVPDSSPQCLPSWGGVHAPNHKRKCSSHACWLPPCHPIPSDWLCHCKKSSYESAECLHTAVTNNHTCVLWRRSVPYSSWHSFVRARNVHRHMLCSVHSTIQRSCYAVLVAISVVVVWMMP